MKNKIVNLLSEKIDFLTNDDISQLIEIPPKPEMGDFAFPCFRLAKELHKAPPVIAKEIADSITLPDYVDHVDIQGAYINFFLKKTGFVQSMVEAVSAEDFGASTEGNGKTICIDYSSPNVAKNFHVGHLRTTIIGNSLYKIYSKLGYKVERINHLGDWGTQFGKLIVAYKNWGDEQAIKEKGVEELMRLYVAFHNAAKENPELDDEARAWFNKMEQGNEEALKIWKWFVDISLTEYKRTYALLGLDFDHFTGESFYRNMTSDIVKKLTDANLLTESEGAKIVDLEEYNMAPCLILKNDGSSIYATRDLAAIFYRKNTYNFVKALYVTGQEQKLHFAQVFKVVELLGNEWAKDQLVHIPYGLVSLNGAKLATREGNVIYAEDILLEAISKIKKTIEEKNPNLEDKDEVARIVGVGAVIFNDLYNQRIKDVSFSWEKLLNFDGETGPYVQYTYARCSSILRKAGIPTDTYKVDLSNVDYSIITDEASVELLKEISRFPAVVKDASEKYEPFIVARFAVAVAQSFNKFYTVNRINVEDENIKNTRIALVKITRKVLKDALDLLGIGVVEEM
ncbi:arginyl-tRNA synthetase [Eubacterium ruminantium]|uniref:Arginine--tRNA ligase n=1 Tax=Eubacterium ruminantium TaxID=42322 RepID=A0A1T4N4X4_9FIRM|nr:MULTISPECIES: arginine--tRNA ligase [Eubacterium]MCR5367280.1 arginine--tRNA ligase [Eubacterium sp.]SCW51773.1 arginyl-tRNA synthetase [Eubacterium ruminantium]SDM66132.1 arginyl-tRNA synthetase [Eubacterium ruminantium]SJZ73928.1 arginyl-tRNA synthetase [Eubacterium ruminantium]